ncbi:hypothetical protein HBF26_03160 [Luteibacter jiangsuensis]|jgi:hypothetical protein|uniref:Bacteriocin-like protein n=1 Tax=Luteibacter jiangsuensis TaxID=637577 RepID=A0ABX0Q076_9GAMM|nr:hypothetical protein [Luteibacter jiangsuensis]NID03870.1 hypothetical protein [Luteibacter jiangsuensis]
MKEVSTLRDLTEAETNMVSGGIRWWYGRPSINVLEMMPDGRAINRAIDNATRGFGSGNWVA